MYFDEYNSPHALVHYGVPGMRKGTRRYQNEDGTLTPEGREHYGVGEERQPGQGTINRESANAISARHEVKRPNQMSAAQKIKNTYRNDWRMARNRGEGVLSSMLSTLTPVGTLRYYSRMKKKKQETYARKRAERAAAGR